MEQKKWSIAVVKKKNKTKARLDMHEEWRWIVGKGTAWVDLKGRNKEVEKWWNRQMSLTGTVTCNP